MKFVMKRAKEERGERKEGKKEDNFKSESFYVFCSKIDAIKRCC
jgi:hypothetical protein